MRAPGATARMSDTRRSALTGSSRSSRTTSGWTSAAPLTAVSGSGAPPTTSTRSLDANCSRMSSRIASESSQWKRRIVTFNLRQGFDGLRWYPADQPAFGMFAARDHGTCRHNSVAQNSGAAQHDDVRPAEHVALQYYR